MFNKISILYLCTGNSCRSQMAEGWTRHLKTSLILPFSAGIEKHGLNNMAVKVMTEVGIDMSNYKSKLISELGKSNFDYIVTVCDQAADSCPVFPGSGKVIRKFFPDPPQLASTKFTEEEKLDCYRKVRDEIKDFVKSLPESLHINR